MLMYYGEDIMVRETSKQAIRYRNTGIEVDIDNSLRQTYACRGDNTREIVNIVKHTEAKCEEEDSKGIGTIVERDLRGPWQRFWQDAWKARAKAKSADRMRFWQDAWKRKAKPTRWMPDLTDDRLPPMPPAKSPKHPKSEDDKDWDDYIDRIGYNV